MLVKIMSNKKFITVNVHYYTHTPFKKITQFFLLETRHHPVLLSPREPSPATISHYARVYSIVT